MKFIASIFLLVMLSGCFKDPTETPQPYTKQEVNIPEEQTICVTYSEDFPHFNLNYTEASDSVHWYEIEWDTAIYLGNTNPYKLNTEPLFTSNITCYNFLNGDTTAHLLEVGYCRRDVFIPTIFTPNGDEINDTWSPRVNPGQTSFSYDLQIRTIDGIIVFRTGNPLVGWDGTMDGNFVPRGAYFYRLEIQFEGEDATIYTGWLDIIG